LSGLQQDLIVVTYVKRNFRLSVYHLSAGPIWVDWCFNKFVLW